jgi:RimJ/RimL family protein N-acetyltransferase
MITHHRHTDITEYARACEPFLLATLTTYNKNYAWLKRFTQAMLADRDARFLRVANAGETVGMAFVTTAPPRRHLVMAATSTAAVDALITMAREDGIAVTSVEDVPENANRFAEAWGPHHEHCRLISYGLEATPGLIPQAGDVRMGHQADSDWITRWKIAFLADCNIHEPPAVVAKETAATLAGDKSPYWIWQVDGQPVSIAAASGDQTAHRIGFVYTPPEHRGKGYSKALMAAMCAQLRKDGVREIYLYADAANPISNHMYRALGFRVLAEFSELAFEPKVDCRA